MQLCINVAILHKIENETLLSSDPGQIELKQQFEKFSAFGFGARNKGI